MLICVYGAGSIGCHVGGRLAAAGGDVAFIGRDRLAHTLAAHGLTVTDLDGTSQHVDAPRYVTTPEAVSQAGLVLVTVKSAATAEAAESIAPLLAPGTIVISLQNGLRNAEVLRERLPEATVLPGMVAFNVVNRGQGVFHRATTGDLEVRRHPQLSAHTALFERAGLPLVQRDDIAAVQAAKLLLNLNNAVNALCGLPLRDQLSQRAFRRCLALAQREALDILAATGTRPARLTPLPPRWIPSLLGAPDAVFTRLAKRMLDVDPLARSSMWEDLEAGRTTEVDYLNGEVVTLAAAAETTAPVNARLVALIRAAETGGRRDWAGGELLAELTAATRLRHAAPRPSCENTAARHVSRQGDRVPTTLPTHRRNPHGPAASPSLRRRGDTPRPRRDPAQTHPGIAGAFGRRLCPAGVRPAQHHQPRLTPAAALLAPTRRHLSTCKYVAVWCGR